MYIDLRLDDRRNEKEKSGTKKEKILLIERNSEICDYLYTNVKGHVHAFRKEEIKFYGSK